MAKKKTDPLSTKDGKKVTSLYLAAMKQLNSSWTTINKEGESIAMAVRRYKAFQDAADNGDEMGPVLWKKYGKSNLSLIKKWIQVNKVITTGKGEIDLS